MTSSIKKTLLLTLLLTSVLFPFVAEAAPQTQTAPGQYQGSEMENQLNAFAGKKGASLGTASDPRIVAAKLIKTSLGVIGIIVVIFGVYGGFLVMTSGGNEEKVGGGKKILVYCVVGVAVILSAYSITLLVYRGIYGSWNNPWTTGTQGGIYIKPNNPTLYNPDPLEQNTTIGGYQGDSISW